MRHDVPIKTAEELAMSRRAAQLAASVLAMIEPHGGTGAYAAI